MIQIIISMTFPNENQFFLSITNIEVFHLLSLGYMFFMVPFVLLITFGILIIYVVETACVGKEIPGSIRGSYNSTSQHRRRAIYWHSSRHVSLFYFLTQLLVKRCLNVYVHWHVKGCCMEENHHP